MSFATFLGWQVFSKWVIGWKAPPLEHTWQKSRFVEWSRWSNKIDHSCKFLSEWQICSDWDIWWQVYFLWYRGKWLSCVNSIMEFTLPSPSWISWSLRFLLILIFWICDLFLAFEIPHTNTCPIYQRTQQSWKKNYWHWTFTRGK